MSDIRNENGSDAEYWPITGLPAGSVSNTRTFLIDTPLNGILYATDHDKVRVHCTCAAAGIVARDLGSNPIDLSAISAGPDTEFEIWVEALTPIVGLYRVPLAVGAGIANPAGWVEA